MDRMAQLDSFIAGRPGASVLLHSCCSVCSSHVLSLLSEHFIVTVYYYNPNIAPEEEYRKRKAEQIRLLREMPFARPVSFVDADYRPADFDAAAAGLEGEPEGGARCARCFDLRLSRTAVFAKNEGFDFFATTLTVSPHKNAAVINAIGQALAAEYGVAWLPADFKKRDGYRHAGELARQYGLYRQNYCGCAFSRQPDGGFYEKG